MLIFEVNRKTRLICGNSGWEIQEKVGNKSVAEGYQWQGRAWFTTLGGACRALGLRVCQEAETLDEALKNLEMLGTRLIDSKLWMLENTGNKVEHE